MKANNKQLVFLSVLLIFMAAVSRLIPHPPNFAPITSLAIFGGAIIKDHKYAMVLPLGALLLSDIIFEFFTSTQGFYDISQVFVYGAFILITFLATRIKKINTFNIVLACIWSSVLFFVLSNFGTWATGNYYPRTFNGLVTCYEAAIPFYKNEFFGNFALNNVMSTFFFTGLLFGAYALIRRMVVTPATQIA